MSQFSSSTFFTLSLSSDDSSGYSVSYSSNSFILKLNLHLVGNELYVKENVIWTDKYTWKYTRVFGHMDYSVACADKAFSDFEVI